MLCSGFRAAGIYPFNPDKFSEFDFAPARGLDELRVVAAPDYDSPSTSLVDKETSSANPSPTTSPTVGLYDDPLPSTSTGIFSGSHKTFLTYLPALKAKKKPDVGIKTRKPREKQHSEILTSTPMKLKLELCVENIKLQEL